MWFFNGTLVWYHTHTQTQTHTHTHKHTNTHTFKWLNEYFTDIKNLLFTMPFLFKNYSLCKKSYIGWLDAIRPDSSCEIEIMLI